VVPRIGKQDDVIPWGDPWGKTIWDPKLKTPVFPHYICNGEAFGMMQVQCASMVIELYCNCLFRRADGAVPNFNSRLCSCHFKDGLRENDPSIFNRNEDKSLQFLSPEKRLINFIVLASIFLL